jgi:protein ImuB
LLVVASEGQKRVVASCCELAASAGVRAGLPLGEACAVLPVDGYRIVPQKLERDAAALRALAVWASRYSPVVAVDGLDGLLIDATGVGHVFGGEERMVERVERELAGLGFAARVAIAPTYAAAWALARYAKRERVVVGSAAREGDVGRAGVVGGGEVDWRGEVRGEVDGLPVAALGVGEEVVAGLDEVGIVRIGQLLDMPRRLLPARFGNELTLRLDQLLGRAIEAIEPVRWREPAGVEFVLDGPTTRVEDIERIVLDLVDRLCELLATRERGARRVELALERADLEPVVVVLSFTRPSRDPRHWRSMIRPRLEKIHLGFGVERITLVAPRSAGVVHDQRERWRTDAAENRRAVAEFIDAVNNRLGSGAVLRAVPVESHVPERAYSIQDAEAVVPRGGAVAGGDRPTMLLSVAMPIEVVALSPGGAPERIRSKDEEHAVVVAIGPERIAGEWWRDEATPKTRDYFRVQTGDGRWLWVYRCIEDGRWFLHGMWA